MDNTILNAIQNTDAYEHSILAILNELYMINEIDDKRLNEYPLSEEQFERLNRPLFNSVIQDSSKRKYMIDCSSKSFWIPFAKEALYTGFLSSVELFNMFVPSIRAVLDKYVSHEYTDQYALSIISRIQTQASLYAESSMYHLFQTFDKSVDDKKHKEILADLYVEFLRDWLCDFPEDEKAKAIQQSYESELSKLKKELSKSFSYEEVRQYKAYLQEAEQNKHNWERDKQELNSLRELAYTYGQDERDKEIEDNTVTWPHKTTKNIYVLGGHESWYKQIKEYLPDLKFIRDNNMRLDDKLSKADQVWFQVNALAHSRYYAATNITDKNHIPVRYFKHDSAKSCAIQFVQEYNK